MTFSGTTVWITGASSGIGEALAYDLSRRGARLVLSSRRADVLHAVRERCARPDDHLVVPLDLADPPSIQDAADRVLGTAHAVDILVNNGGISQRSTARETDMDVVRRVMEINFFGTVGLTKAVLPTMLGRKRGHIVITSSIVGTFGTPMRSAYAASKHALHGYFDSLRAETHDDGIRVTMVCPGFVATEVGANAVTSDGTPLGETRQVEPKGIPPEDCAQAIATSIQENKAEVVIGGWETAGVYVKRIAPGLFRRVIRTINM